MTRTKNKRAVVMIGNNRNYIEAVMAALMAIGGIPCHEWVKRRLSTLGPEASFLLQPGSRYAPDAGTIVDGSGAITDYLAVDYKGYARFDARVDLQSLLDFIAEPPAPPIVVGGHEVEFAPGEIKVGCVIVTNETVKKIAERLLPKEEA